MLKNIKRKLPVASVIEEALATHDDSDSCGSDAESSDISDNDGEEEEVTKVDEYADHDTSDEEDIRNTIGNVPLNWYDEYKHIGYDWDGRKIEKGTTRDELDTFLQRIEDPNFWRTVKDPQTGKDVVLSDEDVKLIKRINAQKVPDVNFEEYAPWIEWFTSEVMKMPLRKFPAAQTFIYSQQERGQKSF
ncbi:hypothetical protein FQA39_LY19226 [Lamprigera yunnana]|nr:hypothetical protein FQA39_LY19226 [Lamprigera yunnana]